MPDVFHTALTDFKRVETTKYAGFTSVATIKSRQQHNEDCVRWQIEADQPRSHHRAVDARAVERNQGVDAAHFKNNSQKDCRHRAASGLRASGSFAKKVSAKKSARGIARCGVDWSMV